MRNSKEIIQSNNLKNIGKLLSTSSSSMASIYANKCANFAIFSNKAKTLNYLAKNHSNLLNIHDSSQVYSAIGDNYLEVIKAIIENNLVSMDKSGSSFLTEAIIQSCSIEMIKLLIFHGAEVKLSHLVDSIHACEEGHLKYDDFKYLFDVHINQIECDPEKTKESAFEKMLELIGSHNSYLKKAILEGDSRLESKKDLKASELSL